MLLITGAGEQQPRDRLTRPLFTSIISLAGRAGPRPRSPASTSRGMTIYRLKDGRTIGGERIGGVGERIAVKQQDGKLVLIAKDDVVKAEESAGD